LAHPVGLLWPMLVRNVVADVIPILKHPQLCLDCFRRYALTLFRWHKPVATAMDYQQEALYLFRHTLQVELLQLVERILLVSGFEAVYLCFAAYHGAPFEVLSLIVRPTVFNRGLYPVLKSRGTYSELASKAHAHYTHAV